MTAKGEGLTVCKGVTVTADEIKLDISETNQWRVFMDRSSVSWLYMMYPAGKVSASACAPCTLPSLMAKISVVVTIESTYFNRDFCPSN